ncbi:hypothetical protein P0136_05410 [Lentisphaerota bacterium ZTH]|nr:hypothetical protein JYG24_03475 [Lentisphaerota bacterium]WET07428.1 hypothetical protein P0136_05410 [Lentisphaerota bacterium ZTH]
MKSKILLLVLLGVLAMPLTSWGQIAMRLELSRHYFLQYEPVFAKILLRNDSGHAVAFGNHKKLQGQLLFEIIDSRQRRISRIKGTVYPMVGILLRPGATREIVVPVNKYYNLLKCGKYRIKAFIQHNMFEDSYQSNECTFDISQGSVIWQRTVGVPDFAEKKQIKRVKTRTFTIRCLLEGQRKTYYLLLEDKKKIYSIKRIGFELGEERMVCDVDNFSRLHIMLPISPKVFTCLIYNINGELESREVYKRTDTIPTLIRDPKTGKVYVAGGEKAIKKLDYEDHKEK